MSDSCPELEMGALVLALKRLLYVAQVITVLYDFKFLLGLPIHRYRY